MAEANCIPNATTDPHQEKPTDEMTVSVELRADQLNRLDKLAVWYGLSLVALIGAAIDRYLDAGEPAMVKSNLKNQGSR